MLNNTPLFLVVADPKSTTETILGFENSLDDALQILKTAFSEYNHISIIEVDREWAAKQAIMMDAMVI